jgi:hypothetical protein
MGLIPSITDVDDYFVFGETRNEVSLDYYDTIPRGK